MSAPIIWNGNAARLLKPALIIPGSTSGTLTQQPAAATTSYTITWPSAQGAASTFLKNDGSGGLSWATGAGSSAFIGVRAYGSTTSISGTPATVSWGTVTIDTASGLSGGTYTVATAGKYLVAAYIRVNGTFNQSNGNMSIYIRKNSSTYSAVDHYHNNSTTVNPIIMHTCAEDIMDCAVSDTIDIQVQASAVTSPSLQNDNQTRIIIAYLGT